LQYFKDGVWTQGALLIQLGPRGEWPMSSMRQGVMAPYAGSSITPRQTKQQSGFCVVPRSDPEVRDVRRQLKEQDNRMNAVQDAIEGYGDLYEDLRNSIGDMKGELNEVMNMAGRRKAKMNVEKATKAVLHLADTFDMLDLNGSGNIDVAELRRGLHLLGMDSHSAQADLIIDRYSRTEKIEIKTFATLVRDIHLLLTFDQDGS
jgi:hypothetical protein